MLGLAVSKMGLNLSNAAQCVHITLFYLEKSYTATYETGTLSHCQSTVLNGLTGQMLDSTAKIKCCHSVLYFMLLKDLFLYQ